MSKRYLLILFLSTAFAQAQGEANIWYFGQNAGLDFNSGSPVALLDGQINTYEGCAIISTSDGQLLFYTDGITIYIGGDGYSAPVILRSSGTPQSEQYYYLHRDYLGSILAITDQAATVVEKRHFDAWGNIVRVSDGAGNALPGLTFLDRGYTGHEHLQGVNLIHMNGRLYDPVVHRFLQPDNFVQDPSNTQNYNRYSYVMNNPLMFTDFSGESWNSWWAANWKTVVTIAAAVGTAVVIVASLGTATPLVAAFWAGAGAGLVGGVVGTRLNGGSWEDSLLSGVKGAVLGGALGIASAGATAVIGAVGIIPGMVSGASISATAGAFGNLISGRPLDEGLGLNLAFGAVGGSLSGLSAAKASGSGIWFGTQAKPSTAVIAGNINNSTEQAQKAFNKLSRAQAKETTTELGKYPGDFVQTDKAGNTGTPNTSQMQTAPNGKPIRLIRYDADGNAVFRVDFKPFKPGEIPLHGHILSIPGNLGSAIENQHLSIMQIPPRYFNLN